MRLLLPILIVLALIIGGGFWMNSSLANSTDNLTAQIEIINKKVKNNDFASAISEVEELERKWEKESKWWPILLDHQAIDNIEFSLSKIKEYVTQHSKPLALGQLSELKLMLKHIPEKEELTIKNIL
ncbi:MAG: DUF4363 family protein [Syntrophomonadaceae bacterium]|nr:DUF4363 family protein [Syntrophomonadaceae bacterium]